MGIERWEVCTWWIMEVKRNKMMGLEIDMEFEDGLSPALVRLKRLWWCQDSQNKFHRYFPSLYLELSWVCVKVFVDIKKAIMISYYEAGKDSSRDPRTAAP